MRSILAGTSTPTREMQTKNWLANLGLPGEPLSIQERGLFTHQIEETCFETIHDLHLVQGI